MCAQQIWQVNETKYCLISGTFIALDQVMRMYDDPMQSEIDVFNAVYQLRKERRYLVQTLSQYTYLYKCLYEHAQKKNPSWKKIYCTSNQNEKPEKVASSA